jgi:REP element-mobilizing transposase RayT
MVRPLRLLVEVGSYHVTTQGIERRNIYVDDTDRAAFLALLDRTVARFGWHCLTYCLMDNHFHLLVQTPQPNLSRGMQQLKGSYARAFNERHGRVGYLFGGRFKAKLIQKDAHLLEVFRYIALNPVRAGLCAEPAEWSWSAHAAIAGEVPPQRFLAVEEARKWFSSPLDAEGTRAYRKFVGASEPVPGEDDRVVAGDPAFLRSVLPATSPGSEFRKRDWGPGRPPLSELLYGGHAGASIARAYREHGYTLSEIASVLGCHVSTVSRRLRAHEAAMLDCKI